MDEVVESIGLSEAERQFLAGLEKNLPIAADLSRADLLVYARTRGGYVVVSQARPHSMASIYPQAIVGSEVNAQGAGEIERVFASGRSHTEEVERLGSRAPLVRQLSPIRGPRGRTIGVLAIETNQIEHSRLRRRHRPFRRALAMLQCAALCQEVAGVGVLIPFGEQDGIVLLDAHRRIRYLSGIATTFYRRLGYMEALVGQHLDYLETGDDELVDMSLSLKRCLRDETQRYGREWIRQTLPVLPATPRMARLRRLVGLGSEPESATVVFLMVHDETEVRRRQRELQVKSTMIQETHHRVKNNLQTIAALLRMEARRTNSEEAKRVLEESLNRILSISIVHEFMANQGEREIDLREVGQRLVTHVRQMLSYPDRHIQLSFSGPDIYLPAQQATVCSLVMNELLQNAVEHGFKEGESGVVRLRLAETADKVVIEVSDDGSGLPAEFDLQRDGSVGLNIVRVLVQDDLKGEVALKSGGGVTATVTFRKPTVEVKESGTDQSYHR